MVVDNRDFLRGCIHAARMLIRDGHRAHYYLNQWEEELAKEGHAQDAGRERRDREAEGNDQPPAGRSVEVPGNPGRDTGRDGTGLEPDPGGQAGADQDGTDPVLTDELLERADELVKSHSRDIGPATLRQHIRALANEVRRLREEGADSERCGCRFDHDTGEQKQECQLHREIDRRARLGEAEQWNERGGMASDYKWRRDRIRELKGEVGSRRPVDSAGHDKPASPPCTCSLPQVDPRCLVHGDTTV